MALTARNHLYFTETYVYENYSLCGCASLWNVYKLALMFAADADLIAPVDFRFDSALLQTSYAIYMGLTLVMAGGIAIYVCFVEIEFLRCAVVLSLFLSIAIPSGADYRLVYAAIAGGLLVSIRSKRPHDLLALIFVSIALIPKREVILEFAGKTESGFADVSLQVLLDPILILIAILLIVHDSSRVFVLRRGERQFTRMVRSLSPRSIVRRGVPPLIQRT